MCHPLLAFGSLTLASGYQADETVQPSARKRPSGWRLIRRAVGVLATFSADSDLEKESCQIPFQFKRLSIPEVVAIESLGFKDGRGLFAESARARRKSNQASHCKCASTPDP